MYYDVTFQFAADEEINYDERLCWDKIDLRVNLDISVILQVLKHEEFLLQLPLPTVDITCPSSDSKAYKLPNFRIKDC